MIPAIVLAAGRSSRMGRAKALLPVGDDTFLTRILRTLSEAGIDEIIVVLGAQAADIRSSVPDVPSGIHIVENREYGRGQLSSLIVGLDAADTPDVSAVLVTLIDLPLISPASVRAVRDAGLRTPRPPIARATFGGRHGHPVVFGRAVFAELRQADPSVGARAVVHAHASDIADVQVDDSAVLIDIDTWEDYKRHIGSRPA